MSDPVNGKVGKCDVITIPLEICDSDGIPTVAKLKVKESLGCEESVFADEDRSLKCKIIDKGVDELAGTALFQKASKRTCHLKMDSHITKKDGDSRRYQSTSDVIDRCVVGKKDK